METFGTVDCRPNWYKNYSDALADWVSGKEEYRVLWKDNDGTERRYATYAKHGLDAVMNCVSAHPIAIAEIVEAHRFASYDLMTLEQFAKAVDDILHNKHGFHQGYVNNHMMLVKSHYHRGSTPAESAEGIVYEIEYGDEGT